MSEDPKSASNEEVVALAKEAIEHARAETRRSIADDEGAAKELQPGITIDLGHKKILRLPDEVIDIIKDDIERLALSHNSLSSLPSRLSDCSRLRYLNVRYNSMTELPQAVLQLSSLEILDVSKNKLRSLPDEIINLTSLKVLAVQKNLIERLPLCLGEIGSLQVLKLDGNPVTFPPPDVCSIKKDTPSPSNENEKDAVITTQVKRYLRQITTRERLRVESEGESSEGNVETPRPPKRSLGGRFPVKPSKSGTDFIADAKAESPGPPPPIPDRSLHRGHYRGLSQQNTRARRPPVAPLHIGTANERNRSQSESATSSINSSRANKRMGMYNNKGAKLGPVDERTRRNSHSRGYSQGSLVFGKASVATGSNALSSAALAENGAHRPPVNRPLSDLLEHKRRSKAPDLVVEAIKNILYGLSQLHVSILNTMRSVKNSTPGNGFREFPRRFAAASLQIRSLRGLLEKYDTLAEEDDEEAQKLSESVRISCYRTLRQYMFIIISLFESIPNIARNGDSRFVRTLFLLLQGATVEIRNACSLLGADLQDTPKTPRMVYRQRSGILANRERTYADRNFHGAQPVMNGSLGPQITLPPAVSLHDMDSGRTSTMTSVGAATPRSGGSFETATTLAMSRTTSLQSTDDSEEEAQFERIVLTLRRACTYTMDNLSVCQDQFIKSQRELHGSDDIRLQCLGNLIQKTADVMATASNLLYRLNGIKLREPTIRGQQDFWHQCTIYVEAWSDLAANVAGEPRRLGLINEEVKIAMKPIHKAVKDVSLLINDSHWSHLAVRNHSSIVQTAMHPPPIAGTKSNSSGYTIPGSLNPSISSSHVHAMPSLGYITPVPATPLSAALGAAAQATVPSTPGQIPIQTPVSLHGFSQGPIQTHFGSLNFFERADKLLQTTQRRV